MARYGAQDCEERVHGFCGEDAIQEEVVELDNSLWLATGLQQQYLLYG
jgi:hypothetical protein